MNKAWVVVFDDHCPDPARYVAGAFTSEQLANDYIARKAAKAAAEYPRNGIAYYQRPETWAADYEVEEVDVDPV